MSRSICASVGLFPPDHLTKNYLIDVLPRSKILIVLFHCSWTNSFERVSYFSVLGILFHFCLLSLRRFELPFRFVAIYPIFIISYNAFVQERVVSDVNKPLFSADYTMLFLFKDRFCCHSFYVQNLRKNHFAWPISSMIPLMLNLLLLSTVSFIFFKFSFDLFWAFLVPFILWMPSWM